MTVTPLDYQALQSQWKLPVTSAHSKKIAPLESNVNDLHYYFNVFFFPSIFRPARGADRSPEEWWLFPHTVLLARARRMAALASPPVSVFWKEDRKYKRSGWSPCYWVCVGERVCVSVSQLPCLVKITKFFTWVALFGQSPPSIDPFRVKFL